MDRPKVIMITGAARRIGARLTRCLHQSGMNIILHYHNSGKDAAALVKDLTTQRAESVKQVRGDLGECKNIPGLIEQAASLFGHIDVLINNASSFFPTDLGEIDETVWDDLINVNLKAPLFLTQAAAPYLKASQGCIINIVDIHGDRPLKGYCVYSVAKAGLAMLTKSTARELAPEIRVNGIAPGAIMWPEIAHYEDIHHEIISRTALKRKGAPEDVADAALFLIDRANYITGQIITVDGGRTLSN